MLVDSEALNEHVVYIHFDRLTDVFSEHMIYQSLVCGTLIFKSEGHNLIIV